MNFQKTDCFGPAVLSPLEILLGLLLLAAVLVRLGHQGLLVHSGYWMMAFVPGSDPLVQNVIVAGMIHLVTLAACFLYTRMARRIRPSREASSRAEIPANGVRQPPFAPFSASPAS